MSVPDPAPRPDQEGPNQALPDAALRVLQETFGFKSNWDPAGMTWRLLPRRVQASKYGSEEEVIRAVAKFQPREHFL